MPFGSGVLPKSTGRIVAFALFVTALSPQLASTAQVPGSVMGTVTDNTTGLLPGVKVTLVTATSERTVVTGADGRYQVLDLPPGTYRAKAEFPGFETAVEESVVVETGVTTALHFALKLGCIHPDLRVDFGWPLTLEKAAAVVHLRIVDSRGRCPTTVPFCVCTEHLAEVVRVVKARQREVSPSTIRFLQEGGLYLREEKPYAPGQEYVALLGWDASSDRFWTYGPRYMFPIHEGRVEFLQTDTPGLSDGMRVEDFTRALRKLMP
jgi:hypothetical protein